MNPPTKLRLSRCCKAVIEYEVLGNVILVWREVRGRKVYAGRCSKCQCSIAVDAGKVARS